MSDHLDRLSSNLRAMHGQAGVELPDDLAMAAPMVYVGSKSSRPLIQHLVKDLVPHLVTAGLYLRGGLIGTVNERTGEFELMTPQILPTWLPDKVLLHQGFETDPATGKRKAIDSELSIEQAVLILNSKQLRAKLPEIIDVNLVPLPVFRDELDERDDPKRKGFKKLELLKPGYDPQTKSYTVHGCPDIDSDWDGQEAAAWLFQHLKTFDWSDKDEKGISNRLAVHVSCGMSVFCRYLFEGKTPLFLYNSNLEGSGKGVLVQWNLLPVFRRVGLDSIDFMNRKEVLNLLDTKASTMENGAGYVFGDELPEGCELRDQTVARWATTPTWEMRPMHQNKRMEKFDITKIVTIFTGNKITVNRNLNRRVLHADLFPRLTSDKREHPKDMILIDAAFLKNTANLNKILQAQWAILKLWDEMNRRGTKDRWKESFEGWSELIPGIIETSGLGRPLAEFEAPGAGDDDSRSMRMLVMSIIEDHCMVLHSDGEKEFREAVTVTMSEIVGVARRRRLFEDRLGTIEDVMRQLEGMKSFKWKMVEEEDPFDPSKTQLVEPDEKAKEYQAAAYVDGKVGAGWGKFFRRMAVAGQWFEGPDKVWYAFGDRSSKSSGSRFKLQKVKR